MEGFFCLKYLGHQECSFQDFVGFYKELTKSFDVFWGCFSWTCNIFDGESWVVYKAEYKSVRQEIPKNRRGKKKKFSHASLPQSLLSCEADLALYSNLMFNPIHDFDVIPEECLQIFVFRILALFTSTTSSVPPVCSICSCPSIISSQPGGGGVGYHLLALSAVLLLLLLVLLLRLVQLLWSPHLFELSTLIHLHGH